MAVYSMTGYASAASQALVSPSEPSTPSEAGGAAATVTVELRSVNSRFLDLAFRMPDDLRAIEPALRELLTASFRRGKIELRMNTQREADTALPQPQVDQLNRLAGIEATVQGWLANAQPLSVHEVLQWCRGSAPAEKLDEPALAATRQCITGLIEARAREGERLVGILMERITKLRELAAQAAPLVPQVVEKQQQRFLERWQQALEAAGAAQSMSAETLRERALSEAAAYAIRIDVAEELSRLNAHLDEIARLLKSGGELGKRLDFLIQELHREANTLGSKASALELTQISVEMKVLIEQMREQVQNIE
ncbi:YicC family protein [Aquabacterium sp. A7-Y]|uniref:YicC/YloC family endoribonuclease n=1 Tax=Aquabacterium sp. A7-Y TaxID=1349605 RepID=UPI00223D36BD|nr:YicC/YloC family endoribonuclease [Aquabacterium sp. A7-Y]MCW7541044.1 YicC family protein [Aquabacterium sp. A7-Y]